MRQANRFEAIDCRNLALDREGLWKELLKDPPAWLQVNRYFRQRLLKACLYVVNVADNSKYSDDAVSLTKFLNATANLSEDIASRSFIHSMSYSDRDLDENFRHYGRGWGTPPPRDLERHEWLIDETEERENEGKLEKERAQAITLMKALPPHLPSLTWRSPLPIDEELGRTLEALRIEDVVLSGSGYYSGEHKETARREMCQAPTMQPPQPLYFRAT